MNTSQLSLAALRCQLKDCDEVQFAFLERALRGDERKGVAQAFQMARARLNRQAAETKRLASLYTFEQSLAASVSGKVVVGLDEVGRGSLAGPLAVGAVVLPEYPRIQGLNDSKQLQPHVRESIAEQIKLLALAWTVAYVSSDEINAVGMAACLRQAFGRALARIDASGVLVDTVLIDGHSLLSDEREVSVIKGDSRCASIAAASIVAKVDRDALMKTYGSIYPHYAFESSKGYASPAHISAIKRFGLTPLHRIQFCQAFTRRS